MRTGVCKCMPRVCVYGFGEETVHRHVMVSCGLLSHTRACRHADTRTHVHTKGGLSHPQGFSASVFRSWICWAPSPVLVSRWAGTSVSGHLVSRSLCGDSSGNADV